MRVPPMSGNCVGNGGAQYGIGRGSFARGVTKASDTHNPRLFSLSPPKESILIGIKRVR